MPAGNAASLLPCQISWRRRQSTPHLNLPDYNNLLRLSTIQPGPLGRSTRATPAAAPTLESASGCSCGGHINALQPGRFGWHSRCYLAGVQQCAVGRRWLLRSNPPASVRQRTAARRRGHMQGCLAGLRLHAGSRQGRCWRRASSLAASLRKSLPGRRRRCGREITCMRYTQECEGPDHADHMLQTPACSTQGKQCMLLR